MKPIHYYFLLVILIVAILGLEGGYLLGVSHRDNPVMLATKSASPTPNPAIFNVQFAEIQGKVTAINGNMISISNIKGVSSEFAVSPNLIVYPSDQSNKPITGTAGIPLNQTALIRLEMSKGQYEVAQIFLQQTSAPTQASPLSTPTGTAKSH